MSGAAARPVCDAGFGLIRAFEGCHRIGDDLLVYPYHDPIGLPTQGWGRLLSREPWADLNRWPPIAQAQADEWLRDDVQACARAVARLIDVPLTDGQFAALSSFAFNLGAGALQASTLRRKLNRGEYVEAADQFLRWVFAGGVKLRGLERRRQAERDLFLSEGIP